GGGYPAVLVGEGIRRSARVLAVVDAYVAMLHDRAYRSARLPEEAFAELGDESGTHFDTAVVRAFGEEVMGTTAPQAAVAGAVASALDTAGLPPLRELTGTDPLTLL